MNFWVTGKSLFEVWSIAHLAFWIFVGSVIWPVWAKDWPWWPHRVLTVLVCLVAAFAWEVFEKYAEVRWPDKWLHPESFINSWISDPLTTIIGVVGMMWMLDRWGR